ncbi:hypothetical protein [Cecembia sp.]|uniref:hypothetical protein n=1 Tax=Cecembia sp. TaxID=1898110 RepID=UPI0025C1A198|nr:hypothetical protein [Cecembia sp.]
MGKEMRVTGFYIVKKIKRLLLLQLGLCIHQSCDIHPVFEERVCPNPIIAELHQVNRLFFSPYQQMRFSTENDTVSLNEFRYNIELDFRPLKHFNSNFSKEDFLLAGCNPRFDVQNISNIRIFNNNSFLGLPPSTDISYLFELPDGTRLSKFRDFSRLENFISLSLMSPLTKTEQLNSKLIFYFKDGSEWVFDSKSPVLIH